MELHHGLSPDTEPPLRDSESALILGARAIAGQQQEKRKMIATTYDFAEELFNKYKNGVREADLIEEVAVSLNIGRDIAAGAVDSLRSRGLATMNYKTGIIVHTESKL